MSIAGDIVGEVIAQLQPIADAYSANIREYCGELDDQGKEWYDLPPNLYSSGGSPVSTILVEYKGIDHEAQDGSNVLYLNTYHVNVWLIAGYRFSPAGKLAGEALQLGDGFEIYDMILDHMAGRKLLKESETILLVHGERTFYGVSEDNPPTWASDEVIAAVVYKLEFSLKASSRWDATGIEAEPVPWYRAVGPVVEGGGGFEVGLDVPINPVSVDFAARSLLPLPNDRISWRSAFPKLPIPTAMFPCADPQSDPDALRDAVDGVSLAGAGALHRRTAAGLYAPDAGGMVRHNPARAVEFLSPWGGYVAPGTGVLDPPTPAAGQTTALAGFLVARLRRAPDPILPLLLKYDIAQNQGWGVVVTETGMILAIASTPQPSPAPPLQAVAGVDFEHDSGQWLGILFAMIYGPGSAICYLLTPHGYSASPLVAPFGSISTATTAPFALGGMLGQMAFASYWHGPSAERLLGFPNTGSTEIEERLRSVYRQLWRGTAHPLNAGAARPFVVAGGTDQITALEVGDDLGSGDIVAKFASNNYSAGAGVMLTVPQDPFVLLGSRRMLPHDGPRTNLLLDSEDFAASSWTGGPSGPTATGPDGMLSAFELPPGTTIDQTVVGATGDLTLSIWARSPAREPIRLVLDTTGELVALGTRWRRIHLPVEDCTSGSISIEAPSSNSADVEIWGAQLETGLLPSAYLPTQGTASNGNWTASRIDWTVLPGPGAKRGKVSAAVVMDAAMLQTPGTYAAFAVRETSGSHYLRALAVVGSDGKVTWKLQGALPGPFDPDVSAPDPAVVEAGAVVEVAVSWHRDAVEMWVDDEMVLRAAPGSGVVGFETEPDRCEILRCDDLTPLDWPGACKELHWWK